MWCIITWSRHHMCCTWLTWYMILTTLLWTTETVHVVFHATTPLAFSLFSTLPFLLVLQAAKGQPGSWCIHTGRPKPISDVSVELMLPASCDSLSGTASVLILKSPLLMEQKPFVTYAWNALSNPVSVHPFYLLHHDYDKHYHYNNTKSYTRSAVLYLPLTPALLVNILYTAICFFQHAISLFSLHRNLSVRKLTQICLILIFSHHEICIVQ